MNIIEVLNTKKNMFQKIEALANRQEKLACDNLMDEYLQLSKQRDLIKNDIEADNKKYKYLFEKVDQKDREMVMTMKKEISEVIKSIMDIDKRVEQLVSEKRTEILGEIKGLKKGRTAVKGYRNKKVSTQPRFIKTVG